MVKQALLDVTPESWDDTLDLNLRAYFFVAQGAVAHLRPVRGKIVNIADVGGLERGRPTSRTASARPAWSCSPKARQSAGA